MCAKKSITKDILITGQEVHSNKKGIYRAGKEYCLISKWECA